MTIIDLTKDVKQQNLYVLGETGVLEVSFDEGKKEKGELFYLIIIIPNNM